MTYPFPSQPVPGATEVRYAEPAPAPQDPYAPTSWGQFKDFRCPSGQRCALRPMDIKDLFQMGLLEKLNALSGVVDQEAIRPAEGLAALDIKKIMSDPQQYVQLLDLIDKIVVYLVAKPAILPASDEEGNPIPHEKRKTGFVYVDTVSFPDKMAIFEESMKGVANMTSFRPGSAEPGNRMAHESGDALPAERGVPHS
jgi:hypothetical protein